MFLRLLGSGSSFDGRVFSGRVEGPRAVVQLPIRNFEMPQKVLCDTWEIVRPTCTQQKSIGPRHVGGKYLCGYWRKTYTVLAIELIGQSSVEFTILWDDGRVKSHMTSWDYLWDKEVV